MARGPDKKPRKYNRKSANNGNGNIFKVSKGNPKTCITMVTYDPKIKRKDNTPLENQIRPLEAKYFNDQLCEKYGFHAITSQHWEVSDKRQAVHCHWMIARKIEYKYELDHLYKHPTKRCKEDRRKRMSMLRALSNILKNSPHAGQGKFLTWKHRLFADSNAESVNPQTKKPWSESMPYLEKDHQRIVIPWDI